MVLAAASGRLDFSKAHSYDYAWLRREMLITEAYENEQMAQIVALWHQRRTAGMAAMGALGNTEGLASFHKEAVELAEYAQLLRLPYSEQFRKSRAKQLRGEMDELKEAWERRFGRKLDDPETQQWLKDMERRGQAQMAKARQDAAKKAIEDRARVKARADWEREKARRPRPRSPGRGRR